MFRVLELSYTVIRRLRSARVYLAPGSVPIRVAQRPGHAGARPGRGPGPAGAQAAVTETGQASSATVGDGLAEVPQAGLRWGPKVPHSESGTESRSSNPLQNPIENVNQIAIRLGK